MGNIHTLFSGFPAFVVDYSNGKFTKKQCIQYTEQVDLVILDVETNAFQFFANILGSLVI
jgi:hypothetical protein